MFEFKQGREIFTANFKSEASDHTLFLSYCKMIKGWKRLQGDSDNFLKEACATSTVSIALTYPDFLLITNGLAKLRIA